MTLKIIHEDSDLIAVSKPVGQLVIPGRGEEDGESLNKTLEERLGQKIFVVHRIDRDTSGLVLFAKNAETHKSLSLQFENRTTQKLYLVLVDGDLEDRGKIDFPLKEYGSGRMGIHISGKPSLTDYWVKERFGLATLVEARLHSGRRHQIRAHFYGIGHAVWGDTIYGKTRPVGGAPRLMLHARSLAFEAPGGKELTLTADLPPDFTAVLSTLRKKPI